MTEIVLDRATYVEFPNNPEVNVRNIRIESGSLLLEEILCTENIVFGETNATRFEATIYNLTDVSGLKIKVYQTDTSGNNRRNIFEGYVDSCKQDKNGHYRKLVAYDAFYSIGNANVAGWWLQFWSSRKTATLKELRESLCDWVGISYSMYVSLLNDDFVCSKSATLSSVSFNTMLFWICEIQCTIPHIDRNGTLQYISLITQPSINISDQYDRGTSEFEGFVTAHIDTVELYDYDNNLIATTNSTGAVPSKNTYTIKDNALLFSITDKSAALDFVHTYLVYAGQIVYTPCDINMIVSNLDINVGNSVQVGDIRSIVLQNTLYGNLLVEQEIVAAGSEYSQDSNKTLTAEYLTIEKKTDQIKDDIITDDLLNYAHTNTESYTIGNMATTIIGITIDMPTTSNLVFLATINLESVSEETVDVTETVTINGTECEIVRKEKVPVVVEGYFEWNGAEILTNKPTETYSEDGKHLMSLMFFSIGGRPAGTTNTFKVFLKATHGHIYIREHQVNATIISKGSSVGNLPWDGTITINEKITPVQIDEFTSIITSTSDSVDGSADTPTPAIASDILGTITPQFDTIQIDGMTDSVSPTTT